MIRRLFLHLVLGSLLLGVASAWGQQMNRIDQSSPLSRGLLAWWRGAPGFAWSQLMYDVTGRFNGALTNMSGTATSGWVPSTRQGGFMAIAYNGAADRVEFGQAPAMSDLPQKTLCAWVSLVSFGGGNLGRILDKRGSGGWSWQVNNVDVTNGMTLNYDFQGGGGRWGVSNVLTLGPWIHLAVTYDYTNASNTPTFYVNGQAVSTSTIVAANGTFVSDALSALYMGDDGGGTRGFQGQMEDVRVYNLLLRPQEIQRLYSQSLQGDPELFITAALRQQPATPTPRTDTLLPMFHPPRQGR